MADPSDWTRLDAAFDRALALDGAHRDAFLDSLDDDTRARLGPLLADALRDDTLFDHPDDALGKMADAVSDPPAVAEGTRVGPYRIEALVGEGGMGRVYRAHRDDGVYEQTVALKVVRQSLTLAGSDVSARLRRERDLLAALDHPGIARLVDGGETEDGVPYLVTEFVDGKAITDYADAEDLGVEARIRLIVDVARAVDHAHRRFVVHRDLKPSNVLVAERDGAARPVVLDFGIAKLLDAAEDAGSAASPLTRTGMRLLTPAYAAPELYEPTATVTTAADVYGLGALLYELLTGRRPHDDASTPGIAPTTEPTRPSKAVTTRVDGSPSAVASRSRTLAGDLDTICLKALHPDPQRRYASAQNLADDLERHLSGRPVEARPDSRAYVVGRFVRRNRVSVLAGTVALVALVVGLGASMVSLRNERAAVASATAASGRATEAARLLAEVFTSVEPTNGGRGDVTVREALNAGLARISTVEPASLRGYLYAVLGGSYLEIGDFERGDSLLAASVRLLDGSDASPGVRALSVYNQAKSRVLRGDNSGALPFVLRADSLARLDARIDSTLVMSISTQASWIYRNVGQPSDALVWAERGMRWASPSRPGDRASALSTLGRLYLMNERFPEGIAATREALVLYEREQGVNGASVGLTASEMAHNMVVAGRAGDALPFARRGARIAQLTYDEGHHYQFTSMALVGWVLEELGRLREAEAVLDSAATLARDHPGARTATAMSTVSTLAGVRATLGDHAGSEAAAREALAIAETLPRDAEHLDQLGVQVRFQLGMALYRQRKRGAREMLDRALRDVRAFEPQTRTVWMEGDEVKEARQALRALRRGA